MAYLGAIGAAQWLRLIGGLILFGLGISLMIDAKVGIPPWDVLHQGLSLLTGLRIGTITTLIALPILLLWVLLRERPGIGTVANALLIGPVVNLSLPWMPGFDLLPQRLTQMALGIVVVALGSVLYIGAKLGPGPRDGLMMGFSRRTGYSVRVCRTAIEVAVLALGWLLGGNVGIGTLMFALGIGPAVQFLFKLFRPIESA